MLATLIDGGEAPANEKLPAKYVPRRSCACLDPSIMRVRTPKEEYAGAQGLRLGDVEHQMRIDRTLEDLQLSSSEFTFPILLAQALRDDIGAPGSHITVDLIDSWARRLEKSETEPIQNFISDLRWETLPASAEGAQRKRSRIRVPPVPPRCIATRTPERLLGGDATGTLDAGLP